VVVVWAVVEFIWKYVTPPPMMSARTRTSPHQVFFPNFENNLEVSIFPKNGWTLFAKRALNFDCVSI
jgi:hypothetical protein